MSGLRQRNCVLLHWVTIPEGEGAILRENTCPTSLAPLPYELRIKLVHAAACTRQGQTLDCKCWTSLLSAAKGDYTVGVIWGGTGNGPPLYKYTSSLVVLLFRPKLHHWIIAHCGRSLISTIALLILLLSLLLFKQNWNFLIFWCLLLQRPSAILDHPCRVFSGLCHCAKFGWNRCSSFDNMQVLNFTN